MLTLTTPLEETVAYKELVAIGEKKGKEDTQIEIALRMLKKGFDLKTICELTGIPLEEVQKEKLRKETQIEVALRMLQKGFDLKTICELTGISLEEVQKEKLRMEI